MGAQFRRIEKSPDEWKKVLTGEQYKVTVEKGTEAPGSSPLLHEHRGGTYKCVRCGLALFDSDAKFQSGTGWPSFFVPRSEENVRTETDATHGMTRVEVLCARCGSHLGHVFEDGPPPTGLRYCLNGVALEFEP